jgi:Ca2+-binding EF-hand superfamily protein
MSSTELVSLYRRFGPVLFSHFIRRLGDENQAMKATRYAFQELIDAGRTGEREVVQWIRELETPAQVAQTDSLY